jgi:hypothetical protein
VRQRWPVAPKERQGGGAVSTAGPGLVGPDAHLAAETQRALSSRRDFCPALGTKSAPAGFIAPAMSIWCHDLPSSELSAQDGQFSQAFLAARVSPRKTAGLAIGAIACELTTRAL